MPHILPSIDQIDLPEDPSAPRGVHVRDTLWLCEVAVQAMIEGSARERIQRALNTRTTMAVEKLDLKIGGEVDFYREPNTKNVSGWLGPATVVDLSKIN